MAQYEVGFVTSATAAGSIAVEFRATTDPVYITEIGLFANTAVAATLGLGRPANTVGAGGTLTLGQANVSDDAAATAGVVLTGQTTAPTAPTVYMRRAGLPAAIGNGVIWSWPGRGLRVKQGTSLVVVNIALGPTLNGYFVVEE